MFSAIDYKNFLVPFGSSCILLMFFLKRLFKYRDYSHALIVSKMFRKTLTFSLLVLLFAIGAALPIRAQEQEDPSLAVDEKHEKISISVGESRRVLILGANPFPADADIISVREEVPGQEVLISGLRAGTTQLYYWQDGALQYKTVEVVLAPLFLSTTLQPRFRGGRPYFLYTFNNGSSFSDQGFFETPFFAHGLVSTTPTQSGRVVAYSQFSHTEQENTLPVAGLNVQNPNYDFDIGYTSGSTSQFLTSFLGPALLGSRWHFNLTRNDPHQHDLNFFGGMAPPANLLDFSVGKQSYGGSYIYTHQRSTTTQPDFANFSVFTYQPIDSDSFNVAGVVESDVHFNKSFSLKGGYGQSSGGGSELRLRPFYENDQGVTQLSYSFQQHGLQPIMLNALTSDSHSTFLSSSQLLKNQRTFIQGNLYQSSSLPKTVAGTNSSHFVGGGAGIQHQFGQKQSVGFNYGTFTAVSGGAYTLGHSLGGGFSYGVGPAAFFQHDLNYARTDWRVQSNAIALSNSFGIESDWVRYRVNVGSALNHTSSSTTQSLSFSNSADFNVTNGILRTGLAYQIADLRGDNHILLFVPSFIYSLTTTQSLTMSGALAYVPKMSESFSGSLNLQYQRYLGPGVESDPLWKRLLGQGNRSTVSGHVFIDTNYNSYLDPNDTPLPGIQVTLDSKRQVLTNAKGHYEFTRVKAGDHTMSIDEKALAKSAALTETPEVIGKQSFSTESYQPTKLPIPVTFKRATIRVQFLADLNDNRQSDSEDRILSVSKGYLLSPTGEMRNFTTYYHGGGLLGGVEKGVNTVGVDFLDLPEDLVLIGADKQKINVTKYEEYAITFLFSPTRSIRGQIRTRDGSPMPRRLKVTLGQSSSLPDAKGYYWLKDLKPGQSNLQIHGLPKNYCLVMPLPNPLTVPREPLFLPIDIEITKECKDKVTQ